MAVRDIVLSTDEFIRKKSRKVEHFDESLHELLDDMRDTLFDQDGAGLAAVQVGVLKRVFITYANGALMEFVNPEIVETKGEQVNKEGCLSVKDRWAYVCRPKQVTVRAYDRFGSPFTYTTEGFCAQAVCHEYDHLEGILYIDKAIPDNEVKKKKR
ncbi:MAG: peptide deformylase [Clostridia bacterium]|nr:peptide deformylase [Clostridia bacterium]